MLKEFRLWIDQLDFERIYTHRTSQIDPTYYKNEKLFYYLRFASSTGATTSDYNFARFNPNLYDSPSRDPHPVSLTNCVY